MKFLPYFYYLKDPNIVWFNPCWGYLDFWRRLSEFQKERGFDFQKAWRHRDMKRNKEIYTTALAAMCLQYNLPTEYGWWFTKPQQDPPDGLVATPTNEEGGNIMNVREVEIVEHLNGSVKDTIEKKLSKKNYEPHTILVCLLSPEKFEIFDFKKLSEQIRELKLSLTHIFVIGHGCLIPSGGFEKTLTSDEKLKRLNGAMLIQLLPKYTEVPIQPDELCKPFLEGKQSAWLRFESIGKSKGFRQVKVNPPPKLFD